MKTDPFSTHFDIKGDLSERSGYDLEQLVSIAKVQVRQESHQFVDSC